MMATHCLKTWPEFYQEIVNGNKKFEVRKDDRNYQVGDYLTLREYDPGINNKYTGQAVTVKVTHILRNRPPFTPDGYVIMSIDIAWFIG